MGEQEVKKLLEDASISNVTVPRPRKVYAEISPQHLRNAVETIMKNGGRFVIIAALDAWLNIELSYHLDIDGTGVVMKVKIPKENPELPSIVDITPAAEWAEREASELVGVKFIGNPRPENLVLPAGWDGRPMAKPFKPPVDEKVAGVAESILSVGATAPISSLMESRRVEAGLPAKPPAAYTSESSLKEIQDFARSTGFAEEVGYDREKRKLR
ncbi:MAG: NADH-quinone oxidoreductase subunit C, partial [Candidatus Hadarchaeales archaeon]